MMRTLAVSLFFLVGLACSKATEREYVISNISRLLDSYSKVDFSKSTDETIDPQKYDCALKVNEFNRQQSKTLNDLFDQFIQGKMDEDKLLRSILDIRFRNINFFQRHKGFKFDMKYNPFPNIHMGPGSSILCKKLETGNGFNLLGEDYAKYIVGAEGGGLLLRFISIADEKSYDKFGSILTNYEKIREREVKEAFTPLINDNLYVLTQIILGIFSLRTPHHFTYETYDYISASRSLWPLFVNVAQGADPFLLDDDSSLFDNKALINDYEIYATCLLQTSTVKMPLKGLGCIPNRDYIKTLGTLMESGAILGDWKLPSLPPTLDNLRFPQKAATVSPTISDISVDGKSAKSVAVASTSQKSKKGKKKTIVKPTRIDDISEHAKVDTAPLTESVSKPAEVASDTSFDAHLPHQEPSAELNDAPSVKPAEETKEPNDVNMDAETYDFATYNKISNKGKGKFKKETSSTSSSSSTVMTTPTSQEHVFASWNRKLHAQRNLADIPLRTEPVSPTQLKVLEAVFDSSSKITYGVFESLWNHLVSKKSIKTAHKKSHRCLLNSQGKVVGGTFAIHGSRTQYSDDNKRELQDALTLIGCGRSYLSSLENK